MQLNRKSCAGLAVGAFIVAIASTPSASAATLKVRVDSIKSGGMIPEKFSFCQAAATGHLAPGKDISPRITWTAGPRGTKSYAVFFSDSDSPKENRDKMNKEGMTVPASTPRQTYFHMVLVDIPASVRALKEGNASTARVPHGKPATDTKVGVPGLNTFTAVTAGNDALKGKYYGYDGPCPAWNDEISPHHFNFTVYALSVKTLGLGADFDGPAALAALKDKVLAEGKFVALYSTNPAKGAKVPKM
jgi:phosphatidylethanolamine-binding protein (PEBP) family uncharacterized protein